MMKKCGALLVCLLLCGPITLAWAQADNEREVIATGVGSTEDEAKRQAYRAAVQNVVGAMVVGETLVKNDDLVEEKILSYSDGYVTKAEQVGSTKALEGGLMSVTMKVTVRSDRLKEKLVAENLIITEADGENFIAQQSIQRENRIVQEETSREAHQNAVAIVADAIKELPAVLLDATADFSQATIQGDGGGSAVSVAIPVTVSVNQDRYAKFVSRLKQTLKDLGLEYKSLTIPIKDNRSKPDEAVLSDSGLSGCGLSEIWKKKKPVLLLNELVDFEGKLSRWTAYFLTEEIFEAFGGFDKTQARPSVVVELLDGDGEVVVEQDFKFLSKYAGSGKPIFLFYNNDSISQQVITISPIIVRKSAGFYHFASKTGEVFEAAFVLSAEELRRVKSVRCGVLNRSR